MTSPDRLKGRGNTEVIPGMFHVPDFTNPDYHDGSLVHYSHLVATAENMDILARLGGQAFNKIYTHAVQAYDHERHTNFSFRIGSIEARGLDWRYNHRSSQPDHLTKRLRLFLTNELAADTFYDHIVPTSSDWPSRYLDIIEALLKARGYDRPDEKRAAQLARRAELS